MRPRAPGDTLRGLKLFGLSFGKIQATFVEASPAHPALDPAATSEAGLPQDPNAYGYLASESSGAEKKRQQQPSFNGSDPTAKLKVEEALLGALDAATQGLGPAGYDAKTIFQRVASFRPNVPLPSDLGRYAYDGTFLGDMGQAYSASSKLAKIPGVRPATGPSHGRLIYVNGIGNSVESTYQSMQRMADGLHLEVVGLHSASQGKIADVVSSFSDRFRLGKNTASETLCDALRKQLNSRVNPIRVLAHSRGGLIVARALSNLKKRLILDEGYTCPQAERLLSKIEVIGAGVPRTSFPKGPKYCFFMNEADVIVSNFLSKEPPQIESSGDPIEVVRFRSEGDGSWQSRHGLLECYLPQVCAHFAT